VSEVLVLAASYEDDGGKVVGSLLAALPSTALILRAEGECADGRVPVLECDGTIAVVMEPPAGAAGSSSGGGGGALVTAEIEGVVVRRVRLASGGGGATGQ
jgi:hypothetical protein